MYVPPRVSELALYLTSLLLQVHAKPEDPYTLASGLNIESPTSVSIAKRNTASGSTSGSTSLPTVYKYIRNQTGVVGTITNPAGITSNTTAYTIATVGEFRAEYLDTHGFGPGEIERIVKAFDTASSIHKFTALAAGNGMALMELEWFWRLP